MIDDLFKEFYDIIKEHEKITLLSQNNLIKIKIFKDSMNNKIDSIFYTLTESQSESEYDIFEYIFEKLFEVFDSSFSKKITEINEIGYIILSRLELFEFRDQRTIEIARKVLINHCTQIIEEFHSLPDMEIGEILKKYSFILSNVAQRSIKMGDIGDAILISKYIKEMAIKCKDMKGIIPSIIKDLSNMINIRICKESKICYLVIRISKYLNEIGDFYIDSEDFPNIHELVCFESTELCKRCLENDCQRDEKEEICDSVVASLLNLAISAGDKDRTYNKKFYLQNIWIFCSIVYDELKELGNYLVNVLQESGFDKGLINECYNLSFNYLTQTSSVQHYKLIIFRNYYNNN